MPEAGLQDWRLWGAQPTLCGLCLSFPCIWWAPPPLDITHSWFRPGQGLLLPLWKLESPSQDFCPV